MLTVKEAAARLALSQKTVYMLIATGELPGYKFGKAVRVDESDLDVFKDRCRVQPPAPAIQAEPVRRGRKPAAMRPADFEEGYTGLACLRRPAG